MTKKNYSLEQLVKFAKEMNQIDYKLTITSETDKLELLNYRYVELDSIISSLDDKTFAYVSDKVFC